MALGRTEISTLTPELLLRAYAAGVFPMAESRDDAYIHWIDPERRGVLPLDGFHVPRSLRRRIRRATFEIRCDTAFADVVGRCAVLTSDRRDTWINHEIEDAGSISLRIYSHPVGSVELTRGAALSLEA